MVKALASAVVVARCGHAMQAASLGPRLVGGDAELLIEGVRDARCASVHGVVVSRIHGDLLW